MIWLSIALGFLIYGAAMLVLIFSNTSAEPKEVPAAAESDFFHQQYNLLISEFSNVLQERIDQERFYIQREQASLLQKTLNSINTLRCSSMSVSGRVLSADECSGDWWHAHEEDNKLVIWLGDVTGHGVTAAIAASASRAIAGVMQFDKSKSLSEKVFLFNKVFLSLFKGKISQSFIALEIDLETSKYSLVNGSHPPCFVNTKKGCSILPHSLNPHLGSKEDYTFDVDQGQLPEQFQLYLYTDGILEFKRQGRTQWSQRKLAKFLEELSLDENGETLVDTILGKVEKLRDPGVPFEDDITLLCIENTGDCKESLKAG